MFFKRNSKITLWVWTSADGKWTYRNEAEQKVDDFLSKVSKLQGVKLYGKKHHVKQWRDKSITDYYYTKISYSSILQESIKHAISSCGLTLSRDYPFKT